mmetsp:Transcript_20182/g.24928  ORF Transcript_20182/g.24928 Transcript_20182/m.24928 type:complete len:136 (+) Transcript_20182:322-729(+)
MAIYFVSFFYMMHKLNQVERNDINYLINPRESSGEIFMNTCLHMFPNKVNLEMYRQIVLEKQQLQMLRFSHQVGITPTQSSLRVMPIDAQGNQIKPQQPQTMPKQGQMETARDLFVMKDKQALANLGHESLMQQS